MITEVNSGDNSGIIPFTAANAVGNSGSGKLYVSPAITSGGIDGTASAHAVVRSDGAANDILFTAALTGSGYNGVSIVFVDDGSITNGGASVSFNSDTKILTVRIDDGVTTASTVIGAVNGSGISFLASVADGSDGSGAVSVADRGVMFLDADIEAGAGVSLVGVGDMVMAANVRATDEGSGITRVRVGAGARGRLRACDRGRRRDPGRGGDGDSPAPMS